MTLQDIINNKPYLVWYVNDKKALSNGSIVEHILNFGDWDDFLNTEKALGIDELSMIFQMLKNKKRSNLRPQTINYFTKYFEKYA